MNPILALMNLWSMIKSIPWLWRMITHWQDVKLIIEKAYNVVDDARKSGGMPTCNSFDAFLQAVEQVLKSGLIDIPDVDETALANDLYQMRMLLTCSIDNERKTRGLDEK